MRRLLFVFAVLLPTAAAAQQPSALTAADYARAVRYLSAHAAPLVSGWQVRPAWLPDGRFLYRNITADSSEIVLVDPIKRQRTAAATRPPLDEPDLNPGEVGWLLDSV